MGSLYSELKKANPRAFTIDVDYSRNTYLDENGNTSNHACYRCVVASNRTPEHCDKCNVNPDRERLEKAGLL